MNETPAYQLHRLAELAEDLHRLGNEWQANAIRLSHVEGSYKLAYAKARVRQQEGSIPERDAHALIACEGLYESLMQAQAKVQGDRALRDAMTEELRARQSILAQARAEAAWVPTN